jgi:succinoglycan biosynthesis transport protein ExoP
MTAADVYKALWRRRILIVTLTTLVIGGAWFATIQRTKLYRTGVLVRVSQPINDPAQAFGILEAGQQLAQTYARIVQTRTVAQTIYQNLDKKVPLSEIEGNVHGTPVQSLELLTVTADSPSPARAALIANATPDALRAFIKSSGTLHEQITVVESAIPPSVPFSPNLKLTLILALLLGLFVNGAFALLLEVLSDRLPDSDHLEELSGHPVLVTVPPLHFTGGLSSNTTLAQFSQSRRTSAREAFRSGR